MTTVVITDQAICEMAVVPGEGIECTGFQATVFNRSEVGNKALSCVFPLQVEGIGQPFQLTARPLSYEYQQQIMHFTSGHAPLLQFLKKDAFKYEEAGNTCSTLFLNESRNELVGFCAIKCSSLKIKGTKIRSLCPTIEIAALCVADRYRYMGIGQAIFSHAIQKICNIRTGVGVQFITLFAVPEAVNFYRKFNFQSLEKEMKLFKTQAHQSCIPMYYSLPPMKLDQ